MLNRLTDTLDFQGQALQLRSERQRLIASNIANADTPGYMARDMDFAQDAAGGDRRPAGGRRAGDQPRRATSAPAARQARAAPRSPASCSTRRRRRPTSTATPSTWTASAPASPTTR